MHEKLHTLKQEFLEYWPLEQLHKMTLEEYTDTNRKNSFCYWLEQKTNALGGIRGGSSYKFGIYHMGEDSTTKPHKNRDHDSTYAWFKKYGNTREEVFENIKKSGNGIIK